MMIAPLLSLLVAAAPQPAAQMDNVPVGIAVSKESRVFFALSRAIDKDEPMSVVEWKDDKPVPFPPGLKQDKGAPGDDRLLAVQAMTIDANDWLWILDCAKVGQEDVQPGAPKLVAVDLAKNEVVRTIHFPAEVAGPGSFLNDLVVDRARGFIYLTDAAFHGPNGIVVVKLESGESFRMLNDDPSTKPAPGFTANVEGQPLLMKGGKEPGKPFAAGADGIALSGDGKTLYYAPLASHHLFSVATAALVKRGGKATPKDLGDKGFAADGMLGDATGRIYSTDYEHNRVMLYAKGKWTEVANGPDLLWPDSMALAPDGTLWFTTTQIERGEVARGKDERARPFKVWTVKTDSKPLMR